MDEKISPDVYLRDTVDGFKIQLLEKMGPTLDRLFDLMKHKFSLLTVMMIGYQMVLCL